MSDPELFGPSPFIGATNVIRAERRICQNWTAWADDEGRTLHSLVRSGNVIYLPSVALRSDCDER